MNTFLTSNDLKYRLARTIVQGLIAVFITSLAVIFAALPAEYAALLTAAIMAVLSPVMAVLKGEDPEDTLEDK